MWPVAKLSGALCSVSVFVLWKHTIWLEQSVERKMPSDFKFTQTFNPLLTCAAVEWKVAKRCGGGGPQIV